MEHTTNVDLFAEDFAEGLRVEELNDTALLGSWTSSSTVGSASCPGATASSASTGSCTS
ncbi:thiocillin family RiPP [Streptomyces platensis]|uniref:thiocillin family RiPP n=1 Tax=Streptomyces platensis TaxID=58346 RepID=UPI00386864F1|nr:thiocillin family RiPP [Streptomyces platensis]